MRLWVMSDLQTELAPFQVPKELPDADVCA